MSQFIIYNLLITVSTIKRMSDERKGSRCYNVGDTASTMQNTKYKRVQYLIDQVKINTKWGELEKAIWLLCTRLDDESLQHFDNCLKYLKRTVGKDGKGRVMKELDALWNGPAYSYIYLIEGGYVWKYMSKEDFPKYTIANGPPALQQWWSSVRATKFIDWKREIDDHLEEKVNLVLCNYAMGKSDLTSSSSGSRSIASRSSKVCVCHDHKKKK